MKSKLVVALVASALVLSLAGCSGSTSAEGTWGRPDVSGKPSLVLTSGGKLSGSDGCNRLTGSWTESGSTVTFGAIASTLMYCSGVDDWLRGAHTATVSGSTMTVFNDQKKRIGTLHESR